MIVTVTSTPAKNNDHKHDFEMGTEVRTLIITTTDYDNSNDNNNEYYDSNCKNDKNGKIDRKSNMAEMSNAKHDNQSAFSSSKVAVSITADSNSSKKNEMLLSEGKAIINSFDCSDRKSALATAMAVVASLEEGN